MGCGCFLIDAARLRRYEQAAADKPRRPATPAVADLLS
jgi:hypothetical protein